MAQAAGKIVIRDPQSIKTEEMVPTTIHRRKIYGLSAAAMAAIFLMIWLFARS